MLLAACSTAGGPGEDELGFVRGFQGGVAVDEPQAALIGRDVLAAGGNAIDSAVAMFFTMAVTRPSVAGLGSSGQCILFHERSKSVEALDFMAPAGVPGAPRAMLAMHAKYGHLRWEGLLSPAETKARFGFPVSRGFARDLAAASALLADNPSLKRLYAADGRVPGEGERMTQLDLAVTLSLLRQAPGQFYSGNFLQQYVSGARSAGLDVTAEAVRGFAPAFRPTEQVEFGLLTTHFAPSPGGALAARMWTMLTVEEQYRDAAPSARAEVIAQVQSKALAQMTQNATGAGRELLVGGPQAGASFVVADQDSNTVACAFTMGRPFGVGRPAGDSGIVPAAPVTGGEAFAIAPMLAINPRVNKMFFAAAASGGAAAPTATVQVALGALAAEQPLGDALAAPRVHVVAPGRIAREPQVSLGLVNAFHCPLGLISPGAEKPTAVCLVATDRRGFGLAAQQ